MAMAFDVINMEYVVGNRREIITSGVWAPRPAVTIVLSKTSATRGRDRILNLRSQASSRKILIEMTARAGGLKKEGRYTHMTCAAFKKSVFSQVIK